jgi:hypothetical protein
LAGQPAPPVSKQGPRRRRKSKWVRSLGLARRLSGLSSAAAAPPVSSLVSGADFGGDAATVTNRISFGSRPLPYLGEAFPPPRRRAPCTRGAPSCRRRTPPSAPPRCAPTSTAAPPANHVPGFRQPFENRLYFLDVLPANVEPISPAAVSKGDRVRRGHLAVIKVTSDNFPIAPGHRQSPFGYLATHHRAAPTRHSTGSPG